MSEILYEAFKTIYPNKNPPKLEIKYSGKFSDFNANVKIEKLGRQITKLTFALSRNYQESDELIVIGVIQHLLNKVYKTNNETIEQEFYHNFIKNIGRYSTDQGSDEELKVMFNELNEEYFSGLMDMPTLIFGNQTLTVLGHYNYHKDLVTISGALKKEPELTRYVLYHELLHKKHSFTTKNGRGQYHTKAFRDDEKKYFDKDIEKKLQKFVKRKKIKKAFFG